MSVIYEIAFLSVVILFFSTMSLFVYYSIKNTLLIRGKYVHISKVIGVFFLGISVILTALFYGTSLNEFYIKKDIMILLAMFLAIFTFQFIYSLYRYRINRMDESTFIKTLTDMPHGLERSAGICLWYLSFAVLTLNADWGTFFRLAVVTLITLGMVVFAFSEKRFHNSLRKNVSSKRSGKPKNFDILRDQIQTLRVYIEITNTFIRKIKPVVGGEAIEDILKNNAERHLSLLRGAVINVNLTLNREKIEGNLKNIDSTYQLQSILMGFSELNSDLLEIYSAVTSQDLGNEMLEKIYKKTRDAYDDPPVFEDILTSLPEGVLPEEKVKRLSESELEEELIDKQEDLSKAFLEAQLAKKEKKTIIGSLVEPVVVLNEEGVITTINPAFTDVFGYSRKNLLGKEIEDTDFFKNLEKDIKERFLSIIENPSEDRSSDIEEMYLRDKDGNKLAVNYTASCMKKGKTDDCPSTVIVFRDITGKKKVEEFKEMLRSVLTHHVCNNIQIIEGYLELLRDFDPSEEQAEMLDNGLDAISKTRKLIDRVEMLEETRGLKLKGAVNPYFLLEETVEFYRNPAEESGFEIDTKIDDKDVKVRSGGKGGVLIESIFSELIDNAVKHSEGDKISITSREEDDSVVFTFEDNGEGLEKEIKKDIFETEFLVNIEGKEGLGLYHIVKIIKALGGEIEVAGSELGGTRFEVKLKKVDG